MAGLRRTNSEGHFHGKNKFGGVRSDISFLVVLGRSSALLVKC